jgi:hypothetical protein
MSEPGSVEGVQGGAHCGRFAEEQAAAWVDLGYLGHFVDSVAAAGRPR